MPHPSDQTLIAAKDLMEKIESFRREFSTFSDYSDSYKSQLDNNLRIWKSVLEGFNENLKKEVSNLCKYVAKEEGKGDTVLPDQIRELDILQYNIQIVMSMYLRHLGKMKDSYNSLDSKVPQVMSAIKELESTLLTGKEFYEGKNKISFRWAINKNKAENIHNWEKGWSALKKKLDNSIKAELSRLKLLHVTNSKEIQKALAAHDALNQMDAFVKISTLKKANGKDLSALLPKIITLKPVANLLSDKNKKIEDSIKSMILDLFKGSKPINKVIEKLQDINPARIKLISAINNITV